MSNERRRQVDGDLTGKTNMRFEYPIILMFLWCAVPVALVLVLCFKRRKNILRRSMDFELMDKLVRGFSPAKIFWKNACLVLALVFCVFALARPQWGFRLEEIKKQGVDIFIAIDVSKSMLAQDVRPNRLMRAKLAVQDLLQRAEGDRIGLIAFAGEAVTVSPLTSDISGLMLNLQALSPESIPRGGTDLTTAIQQAMNVSTDAGKQKTLVILSDGENWEGDPVQLAKEAKAEKFTIHCVGIGTTKGELIPLPWEGSGQFLKDEEGNVVKTRLNEKVLKDLALATGGVYVRAAGTQTGLDIIYEQVLKKLAKTEYAGGTERVYFERFQWPLSLAVFFFILEIAIGTRKKRDEI